jgi:hypothetical protein
MRRRTALVGLSNLVLIGGLLVTVPAAVTAGSLGVTSQVPLAGTGGPANGTADPSGDGDVTQVEFPGQEDEADGSAGAYPGVINDRSLSTGHASNGVSVNSGKKAKSNPTFKAGFEGLNLFQQRYANRGNQFTVEPPDQALCVGNGYVVEAVNDVFNVFDAAGHSLLPDNTATNVVSGFPTDVGHAVDLNTFYGYAPAINRTTGVRSQFVTDPTCIYDAATQRFFLVVLTLEARPNGSFTQVNHLDLAVSATSNPTGSWNIYRIDVTNDGSNIGGTNPGPYLGDYPHIGADAYGIYLTTNAYPWNANGFGGAQIYALSKAQLAAGAANVTAVHLDTAGLVNAPSDAGATQPGFTVWPAHSPGTSSYDLTNGGTEYLLSSNAADEATHPVAGTGGNYVSNQLVLWTLRNTSSLGTGSPSLGLGTKLIPVGTYALPPKQHQAGSGTAPTTTTPQGHCINDSTTPTIAGIGCWRLLFGGEPAHNEVISTPDSNDTRMQQVVFANGRLWGSLDTALNPDGGAQRAGIAWYILNPSAGKVAMQGYLGATGFDFAYPTIGVTASGRGVVAFTASGDALHPSAAYAPIDANTGVGAWNVVTGGLGQAADDGFTSYKSQVGNPPRTRWGDYGAAAVDGASVWVASEYVAQACDYATWGGRFFGAETGDNKLGTCAASPGAAGSRAALGNWSTRISQFTP